MLTPSLVWAYWMRGSVIGAASNHEQSLRVGDALQLVLAALLERHARRRASQTPDSVRHQHLARSGGACDTRRDVHRAAVDVVPLADDVAGVDAEVQLQPQRLAGGIASQG